MDTTSSSTQKSGIYTNILPKKWRNTNHYAGMDFLWAI